MNEFLANGRRNFLINSIKISGALLLSDVFSACTLLSDENKTNIKISLAEWSVHRSLFAGEITNLDFPLLAKKKYGIHAVEYVNTFFKDKAKDASYLSELNKRSRDEGMTNVLIMIDGEGDLSTQDSGLRNQAIDNHKKWIDAASVLGCASIRVNLHGGTQVEEWKKASIDSLIRLSQFAKDYRINVLAENHGGFSSHGKWISEVVAEVNDPLCGTLVDFNNFCVRREKGDLWESPCVEFYDRYKGVEEMLPFAKGISAKTTEFTEEGEEKHIDFQKMISLVKSSGYQGYMSVEFEGENISEDEGIRKSKALLEKYL